jgi:hypothetical protein
VTDSLRGTYTAPPHSTHASATTVAQSAQISKPSAVIAQGFELFVRDVLVDDRPTAVARFRDDARYAA